MRLSIPLRIVVAAVGLFALAGAKAQAPASGTAATAEAASAESLAEVTVTGSRVITNGNDAPTPVTVVSAEQLTNTEPALTVSQSLGELPMFNGSNSAYNGTGDTVGAGATTVPTFNLRNLGALRVLVLLDGKRLPPSTPDGYVDSNVIPTLLLQRVDVVTGGASAVYGSDAISGVINFVTDTKFQGVKVDLQRGISMYDDDGSYTLSAAFGQNLFGGRAHIEGGYSQHQSDGIPLRFQSNRGWAYQLWTLQGTGAASSPFHLVNNTRTILGTWGGRIVCPSSGYTFPCSGTQSGYTGSLVGDVFESGGVLTPFVNGSTTGISQSSDQIGGGGSYFDSSELLGTTKTDQGFLRFDADLTDQIHAYVTGAEIEDHLEGAAVGLRSFGQGWKIGSCDAYLAASIQAQLGCTNQNSATQPVFELGKILSYSEPGNPSDTDDIWTHDGFIMGGLQGNIGSGYHWDLGGTYSRSSLITHILMLHNQAHLDASLDAVINPANGQIVCDVTLTNPGLYPGCVPLDPFGQSGASAAAIDYDFLGGIQYLEINKLNAFSGSLTGAPFNTWAGPVNTALSAEMRRVSFELQSSTTPSDVLTCQGLRFGNCVPGVTTQWLHTFTPRSPVSQIVYEGALESDVPLLKDEPLVKSLDLDLAGRYTKYDDSAPAPSPSLGFDASTWKLGVVWHINDQLTVRYTRSRDIRAPNLYDLYSPLSIQTNTATVDYLQPNTPFINPTQISGGNPNLQPEVGYTSTVGLVWQPTASFNTTIDLYKIVLTDALVSLNGSSQPIQQACYASGGTSNLCSLIVRPLGCCSNTTSANAITTFYVEEVNIASEEAEGIDFEANYSSSLFGHRFSLRGLATFQPQLIYNEPSVPTQNLAGVAYDNTYGTSVPVWRATAFAHVNVTQAVAVDVQERFRSRYHYNADPVQFAIGGVGSVFYTDMTASYDFHLAGAEASVYFNVQNLLNKPPPPASSSGSTPVANPGTGSNGYVPGDDVVGRYFNVGVRARL